MRRMVIVIGAALAAALLIGCAQARAAVNANVSIDADAGETAGLSSSPTVILKDLNDDGSGGIASVGYGWPVLPFPSLTGFNCPSSGCADKSAGAAASADESSGVLRAGAGASILVGNAPDPNYGGIAFVKSESSVDDTLTLSKAATVVIKGTVHGTQVAMNNDSNQLLDPTVETDVKVGFCCRRFGEAFGLIGGYEQQFTPDAADGSTTTTDEAFSIPVDLPQGDTEFQADLAQDVHMEIDGMPAMVLAENGLADFTGTVTFQVVVPDDVVATSSSGLMPIVGGAPPAPADTTAPASTASLSPTPTPAGWNDGPAVVHIAATDAGGSGVASLTVGTSGAQSSASSTTAGATLDIPVTAEGTTTITYFATDNAGNAETPHALSVKIDQTPPTVTYSGNAGAYTVDEQVAITCHADDSLSGVASTTCHDATGPAYTFALGANTYSATAADYAGNTGSGTTTFTVTADPGSVGKLTLAFVQSSPAYRALSPARQAAADRVAALATRALARMSPGLRLAQKTSILRVYQLALAHLVRDGWLTADEAATLSRLAASS
jgi:hypothetical protein